MGFDAAGSHLLLYFVSVVVRFFVFHPLAYGACGARGARGTGGACGACGVS